MKKLFLNLMMACAAITFFTACEDVPEPYTIKTDDDPSQTITPQGDGTLTSPYNVAAADSLAATLATGDENGQDIYIKGIVSTIKEQFTTTYGNGTFYISDDGTTENQFYIYRAYYLSNKKFSSGDSEISIGDTVIICGRIMNYSGTYETVQNKSYIYSINGGGGEPAEGVYIYETFASDFGVFTAQTVKGTPWTIDYGTANATGYDNSSKTTTASAAYLVSNPVDLSNATAVSITFDYILRYYTNYGSAKSGVEDKLLITDNYTGDPATTSWTDISGTLTEGSDWTTFSQYAKDIPSQFLGKSAVVVALYYACEDNSATWEVKNFIMKDGSVSGDEPTPTPSGDVLEPVNGTFINETFASDFGVFSAKTVKGTAWIIDYSTAKATGYDGSSKTTTASEAYLVSTPMNMSNTTSATISFQYILRYYTNYGESKPGVEDKVLITDNYTGDPATTSWTDITGTLTEGSDWSTFSNYSQSVPSQFLGKAKVVVALYYACGDNSATWEVKNLKVTESGSGDNTGGGDVSGNSITASASSFGIANGVDATTITLSDGTNLNFDGGGNASTPKYYDNGNNIRMYPKNTMTVKASKTISSIKLACDTYNGTICNASGDVTANPGTVSISDADLVISGINSTSTVIKDTSAQTGAASQIRWTSITITYAE